MTHDGEDDLFDSDYKELDIHSAGLHGGVENSAQGMESAGHIAKTVGLVDVVSTAVRLGLEKGVTEVDEFTYPGEGDVLDGEAGAI